MQTTSSAAWLDATTLWRGRAGNPVGLMRVESGLADGLRRRLAGSLRCFAYDRRARRLITIDPAALDRPPPPRAIRREARDGWLRGLGRSIERGIRHALRSVIGGAILWLRGRTAPPPPDGGAGDVAFCLGEIWAPDHLAALRDWHERSHVRLVVVLYDLTPVLFPHWFSDRDLPAQFEAYLEYLRTAVDGVACISEATRRDFLDWAAARGGARGRVAAIRLGDRRPAAAPACAPDGLAGLAPGRFVLSVSTIQVRKNYDLLYALWRRFCEKGTPDLPVLVIAGRRGWLVDDLLTLIECDPLTAGHIVICDDPDDAALAWLYQNCRFTLYPSLYEGWGLPIAESFAYGKACIASDTSSMPEASQGLAIHVDPLDFVAWEREVASLIADDARLAALEGAIRARFRLHSWDDAAAALVALAAAPAPAERAVQGAPAGE